MKPALVILSALVGTTAFACIWDARTMREERKNDPDLAASILNAGKRKAIDPSVRVDVQRLTRDPHPDDVNWINDLAGAYLRLGKPEEAVRLLEPAKGKFPDNYGIHANLGTAYHLLGRYEEAEKEIARDLELNPDAHFGLEKYHLALLQYLLRDREYQRRHLYVDEWTDLFLTYPGRGLRRSTSSKPEPLNPTKDLPLSKEQFEDLKKRNASRIAQHPNPELFRLWIETAGDTPPSYRYKWDLAADTNFTKGVMYMAELNPDQPAALVMAGIVAVNNRAYNLAVAAYERAIKLGSPQADILRAHITELKSYIRRSHAYARGPKLKIAGLIALPIVYFGLRELFRRKKAAVPKPTCAGP